MQFSLQLAMQFYSYNMLTGEECLICEGYISKMQSSCLSANFTSPKERTALQVATKIALCDMGFTFHLFIGKLTGIPHNLCCINLFTNIIGKVTGVRINMKICFVSNRHGDITIYKQLCVKSNSKVVH